MKKKTPKNFNETQVIGCSSVIILGLYKKNKMPEAVKAVFATRKHQKHPVRRRIYRRNYQPGFILTLPNRNFLKM